MLYYEDDNDDQQLEEQEAGVQSPSEPAENNLSSAPPLPRDYIPPYTYQ